MPYFKSQENLDKRMDEKWKAWQERHDHMSIQSLGEMHDLLDWYEHQKKNLKR